MKRFMAIILALCMVFVLCACGAGEESAASADGDTAVQSVDQTTEEGTQTQDAQTTEEAQASAEETAAQESAAVDNGSASQFTPGISYENFCAITVGMTLSEINSLLNSEGTLSQSTTNGGSTQDIYTYIQDQALIDVTYSDGLVVAKAQSGLGQSEQQISLAQFNQITSGMTYSEVAAILGEGVVTGYTVQTDAPMMTCTWSGVAENSVAIVMFQNGTVTSTSQNGLQ